MLKSFFLELVQFRTEILFNLQLICSLILKNKKKAVSLARLKYQDVCFHMLSCNKVTVL